MKRKTKQQGPAHKKLLITYLKTTFSVVIIFFVILAALLFLYNFFGNPNWKEDGLQLPDNVTLPNPFSAAPPKTNFLLLGTDEDGTRTDVMMAGCFDAESGKVELISLPRDTYVTMPDDRLGVLKAEGKTVPQSGVMKLTQVHHYAGKEHSTDYIVLQVEDLLGIHIDYYAEVDLEAFRYLVDAIGGVEFDVPQRMYYNDPTQDLHIDLQPGLQTLNGKQAEGLIRYRKADRYNPKSASYPQGDLERVEVQQAFMKAVIAQTLQKNNVIGNLPALAGTYFQYVKTNFSLSDVPKYAKYLKGLSGESIQTYTLPGAPKTIGGQSYFIMDTTETAALVNQLFFSSPTEKGAPQSSKGKTIQVLNGGYVNGMAGKTRDKLTEAGYTVSAIGDYKDNRQETTRIIVKTEGLGTDLSPYFTQSKIEVDPSYSADYDIVIIVGTGQQ